jgi:NADPH:quinone reductase-like Zn-dependent oxidoreductase
MSHGDWKAMFHGIQQKDLELVRYYLQLGIDVNYQHPEYMTSPLIESIRVGEAAMVQLLLDNGASAQTVEMDTQKSPLAVAKATGNQEIFAIIAAKLKTEGQFGQANGATMQAVVCPAYGPPEVLRVQQVAKPQPKDHEILVKIKATAVNSGDVRVRGLQVSGWMKPVMRLVLGFSRPRKPILGTVYAGVVEQVGRGVSTFKVGDNVFGMTGFGFGTYAEFIAVGEKSNVAIMPKNASSEEAAALIFGGQTALYFLQKAKIGAKPNPKVLIIGATGSVGSAAVQIAKYHGAEVTAVVSSAGLTLMQALGVKNLILYDQADFTQTTARHDIVFDAVGKTTRRQCAKLLAEGGSYQTVGGLEYASETQQQLLLLKELYEKGQLNAVIDKVFPLAEVVEAHQYVDTGRKKGNVVLKVGE